MPRKQQRAAAARHNHGASSLQHLLHEAQRDADGAAAGGRWSAQLSGDEKALAAARRGVPVAMRARGGLAAAASKQPAAAVPSIHAQSRAVSAVEWMRGRSHIADVCVCSVARLRDSDGRFALVAPPSDGRAPLRQSVEENLVSGRERDGIAVSVSVDSALPVRAADKPESPAALVPIGGAPADRVRRRKLCELALRLGAEHGVPHLPHEDDLATEGAEGLCVRLPVRLRLKEWSDLCQLDPWLEVRPKSSPALRSSSD